MRWTVVLLAMALSACNRPGSGTPEAPPEPVGLSRQGCNQGGLWVEFPLEQGTYRITQAAPGVEAILYESMPDVVGYGTRVETPQASFSFERLEDGRVWTAEVVENRCI
ncbi:hypothetical protein [Calidithermus chliarophilus]|uniref:hypothetical protein n=1 Tax=Calidithermus chliarophilus TaxID=52023 RepID=UPI0004232114|nr:hypothetical protein [Calidithermus chliarophilus]